MRYVYLVAQHVGRWGTRESKYEQLEATDVSSTRWSELTGIGQTSCLGTFYFFTPKAFDNIDEYCKGWSLRDCFKLQQNGVKTDRDELFIDFDRKVLEKRMQTFYSGEGLNPSFRETYRVENSSSYDLLSRREKTTFDKANIHRCLYRPFDHRWLYYSPGLTSRPAWAVMQHMLAGKNLGISVSRVVYGAPWRDVLAVNSLTEFGIMAARPGNSAPLFPLYSYPETPRDGLWSTATPIASKRQTNLTSAFTDFFKARLGMTWVEDGKGDRQQTFGPEDVFAYLYAVLHAPTYRVRYAEFLKIDFPRLPLTSNADLFRALCALGDELVRLHLLEGEIPFITSYPERGNNYVEQVRYLDPVPDGAPGRVYINATQYFDGVPPEVWAFHIGGYQVCQKWLKDRRGRPLSLDEMEQYQKTVAALSATIRLMDEIDDTIEEHGGWPIA